MSPGRPPICQCQDDRTGCRGERKEGLAQGSIHEPGRFGGCFFFVLLITDALLLFFSSIFRLFAVKRCARCHLGISANELVMRARDLVYHLHCFNCASCNKALTKGEQFGMKDNMVYCRLHYEMLMQGDYNMTELDSVYRTATGRLPYYNGVGTVQKGRPRKRKTVDPDVHSMNGLGTQSLGE